MIYVYQLENIRKEDDVWVIEYYGGENKDYEEGSWHTESFINEHDAQERYDLLKLNLENI